ncbi:hypothetical protein [uncultured Gammaproteobacteria bacterium]|nr:hypothetical protein [uncultured Gammaproteobacteria bacterium]CAC9643755.1 hypothetical protein [uncultured Gammaproteobacteria bacterium]CAC9984881.1 hypothetical protein [uncultured Gammaproteobacteria bacterium]
MPVYLPSCDSPPHRWLRNFSCRAVNLCSHSPPHRWLRKDNVLQVGVDTDSPPHRWLRNILSLLF